jgi:uncharacterized membrane protein YbhN (UPF0104 family)
MTSVRNFELTRIDTEPLPESFSHSRVRRSLFVIAAVAIIVIAALALLPGLASLRAAFKGADARWIAVAALLELLSCASYVLVFRAVFCQRMSWRTSAEIGLSEEAANSLLSVGGAGGLALGAWILRRGGLPVARIARRTVAFFLLTSLANVGLLAVGGLALAGGLLAGPSERMLLGGIPALVGIGAIALTLAAGRLARALGRRPGRAWLRGGLAALGDGVEEAVDLLRSPWVWVGSVGYLLFDLGVLAVCFLGFGKTVPPADALLLAYLIGQLGGLVPLPGGIGGLDLGLIGALVLYGVNATDAAVAVLAYRGLLLSVPAIVGLPALASLRRRLQREDHDIRACAPGEEVDVLGLGRVRMAAPGLVADPEWVARPPGS